MSECKCESDYVVPAPWDEITILTVVFNYYSGYLAAHFNVFCKEKRLTIGSSSRRAMLFNI